MILVDAITENELNGRFNSLPEKLREALTSERSLTVVNDICQRNRIADEEKIETVRQVVALVILGVVHYYDVGSEIDEALSLNNPKFSGAVADELNAKVFAPLKTELESNYHPLAPSFVDVGIPVTTAVAPIQIPVQKSSVEAKSPVSPPANSSMPAPKMLFQTAPGVPVVNVALPPPTPKLSGVGWSKSTPEQPVVKLSQAPVPSPQGAISSRVPPPAPKPVAIPIRGSVGEFERIAIQKGASQAPVAPAAPANPAPVIIHQDASFKPAQQSPNFRLQPSTKQFDMQKAPQMTTRPAVLELGNTASAAAARVVHYTEYKSPSPTTPVTPITPKAPPVPQGSRQITEIMPQNIPSQATAAAAQNKLIYKDYSEPSVPKAPPIPAPPPLPPKPDQSATKNT